LRDVNAVNAKWNAPESSIAAGCGEFEEAVLFRKI
jgi:hypothetical protein